MLLVHGHRSWKQHQPTQTPEVYLAHWNRSRADKCLGRPKKGGAGGKFNWGANMDLDISFKTRDPKDPNYDSAEEIEKQVSLRSDAAVEGMVWKDQVESLYTCIC